MHDDTCRVAEVLRINDLDAINVQSAQRAHKLA